MIKFRCAHCSKLLGGEDKQAGLVVRCPKCKGKTRVPKPGEAAPVKKLDKLEVVEEDFEIVDEELEVVDEIDLAAFEQEEREEKARPKSRRPPDDEDNDRPRKKPRRPIDDEEDDEDDRPRRKSRRLVDEDEDEDEEDDDRPRRGSDRSRKGRWRRREEPAVFFTRNRFSGLAGVILGFFALIFGIAGFWMFDSLYYPIAALVLGVLFLVAGAIYLIVG